MRHYDIVVVGAGPGGSTAAREAAKNGLKVALIDKRKRIGVPKQCAEGINKNAFSLVRLKIKKEWVSNKIDSLIGSSPGKGAVYIKGRRTQGFILDRKNFDHGLADLAVDNGADLFSGTGVVGLEKSNTIVKLRRKKSIKTKCLIAADGPSSSVARMNGLEPVKNGIGLQYEIKAESDFPNSIQAYVSLNVLNSGWAWIFPKEETLNVGIGSFKMMNLKSFLDRFVKNTNLRGKIVETNGGLIPFHGPVKKIYHGNIMFVGDAAGHTNPVSGGGIPVAMFDGKLAAGIAVEELEKDKLDFSHYQEEWENGVFGLAMRKSLKAQRIFLESLRQGYIDRFFDNLGFEEVTRKSDLFRLLFKAPDLRVLWNLFFIGYYFYKPFEYAW